ncbi:MAG: hypothetical protein V5B36_05550 [Candidatus Accumulibacter sp. UW25]
MASKNKALQLFAWLQLLLSILLAGAIVYGYAIYRTSVGLFIESLSASVISVSQVVAVTADTVASREELIVSTKETLKSARNAIEQIRATLLAQTQYAPQRAEELRAMSEAASKLAEILNNLGMRLIDISTPSGIEFEGYKPMVVMRRPLETDGKYLQDFANQLKTTSDGILHLSKTIATDGEKLGNAFGEMSLQTLKLLEETASNLDSIQKQDLPTAVREMRSTANQLRAVSRELESAEGIGIVLLLIGLLFSGWLFLNSITLLTLIRSKSGGI